MSWRLKLPSTLELDLLDQLELDLQEQMEQQLTSSLVDAELQRLDLLEQLTAMEEASRGRRTW